MPDEKTARFLRELDAFFDRDDADGAGRYLRSVCEEARAASDDRLLFTILNEMMGYYRKTGEKEPGLASVSEGLALTERLGLTGTVAGATAQINAATTLKAFGRPDEALRYYEEADPVYRRLLPASDPRIAGLCNNWALTLVDLARYREAEEKYGEALSILNRTDGQEKDIANTYVNMAHLYEKLENYEKIEICLHQAAAALDADRDRNGYYAFTCRKCAPSFSYFGFFAYAKELEERAVAIYERT